MFIPERFFDILYKNEEMFSKSEINTEFLPGIDFKKIWSTDDVSDSTKGNYLEIFTINIVFCNW